MRARARGLLPALALACVACAPRVGWAPDRDAATREAGAAEPGPGDDAGACETAPVPPPVDVLLVLDQSSSMGTRTPLGPTLWQALTSALDVFMGSPASEGLGIGAVFFPASSSPVACRACDPGCYAAPEFAIASLPAARADLTATLRAREPSGGTPTAAALRGARTHLEAWAASHPDHEVVMVLATDGQASECSPTDAFGLAALAAEALAGPASIRTFVIGVGGVDAADAEVALAGGTSRAYAVGTSLAESDFLAALEDIRARAFECPRRPPPAGP